MSNPQLDDDSAPSEEYELPIGYHSFRRNAIFGLSPRDTRRDELGSILSRPDVYGPMPVEYPDTGDSDQEHDPLSPSSAPVPPQWSRDFAFRPRSQSAHQDSEGSLSPGNSGQISRELELAAKNHVGTHDGVLGDQDDANDADDEDEDESDFDLNAEDYEMMDESGQKEQSGEEEEEQQSQNNEEGPFWKGSGLTWASDSRVQVRDDSGIQDMITLDHPPVYTVVCSIGDPNAGITVLELAFWQDIGKAPHKIWRPYEDLKPYTEDGQVMREYEERRRGILGRGGSTGSE